MGTDIHMVPEMTIDDLWYPCVDAILPGVRDYRLFARMAGVCSGEDVTPITQPRGLPQDCGSRTRELLTHTDLHSHSWLTAEEVIVSIGSNYDASRCLFGLRIYLESLHYRTWRLVFGFDN